MRKIINTFKHGTPDVKRILLGTIIAGIASAGLFIAAFLASIMVCFFGGVAMFFITVALAQTMGIREGLHNDMKNMKQQPDKDDTSEYEQDSVYNKNEEQYYDSNMSAYGNVDDINRYLHSLDSYTESLSNQLNDIDMAASDNITETERDIEEPKRDVAEADEKNNIKKQKIKRKRIPKQKKERIKKERVKKEKFKREKVKKDKVKKEKIIKSKITNNELEEDKNDKINQVHVSMDEGPVTRTYMPSDENVNLRYMDTQDGQARFNVNQRNSGEEKDRLADEVTEMEESEITRITEEKVKEYNKKKIKRTLHKFKVKRDHRMVMVDHCDKLNILQTPAYIWKDNNTFNLLLIESDPRLITFPLYSLTRITYLKKYPANEYSEYSVFRSGGGMLVDMFKPYLPEYTQSTVVGDITSYKNLYGIGPGIFFTNTSASSLFDLLAAEFYVKDKVTDSNKVNVYFKEVYKSNIKLRDNVIDANGYADSISSILDNLARSTVSYNEFKETLNLMIKNKLITQEFAIHYMNVRDKLTR